jgi:hypothetical protein
MKVDKMIARLILTAVVVTLSATPSVADDASQGFARALGVKTLEIYHPAKRPGYACWVTVWKDMKDAVYLSFAEKKRGENKDWQPMPLDVWESLALPQGYHTSFGNGAKDLVSELVVMKSVDNASTWKEIGRSTTKSSDTFSWASLPDGRIVRPISSDYSFWQLGGKMLTWSEVSSDGGNTWKRQADIFEGHNGSGGPYRLRRLSDGTLVQLCTVESSYGPGQERSSRRAKRPYVREELTPCLFFSKTGGESWSGPLPVLPGIHAYEPDFIELSSGDLLLLNSTVQGGPQVRQYVRKSRFGWFPGPVYDVVSGRTPETVVLTRSGLLVGAVRGGEYTCSNDDGAIWHKIAGLPPCNYEPYITELPDGRLFCAWHVGGDLRFGEADQWVGAHAFQLQANLPKPTTLSLERELNGARDRYVNSYLVTLKSGDTPIAGKVVNYSFAKRYGGGGESQVTTDKNGRAHIDLTKEFAGVVNPHAGYSLRAWFEPAKQDTALSPCQSDEYNTYPINTSKQELGWK